MARILVQNFLHCAKFRSAVAQSLSSCHAERVVAIDRAYGELKLGAKQNAEDQPFSPFQNCLGVPTVRGRPRGFFFMADLLVRNASIDLELAPGVVLVAEQTLQNHFSTTNIRCSSTVPWQKLHYLGRDEVYATWYYSEHTIRLHRRCNCLDG